MSDSDDTDLENLRQLALSSLLRKKSAPLQTNALFYRPVSNSNLISIQPVNGIDNSEDDGEAGTENGDDSDQDSSSGSEYAVIEEGLSVSSGDVDQVIEEVIVSEEENASEQEEVAEDAVSIASHDSFDEILNSVEEEIRGSKRRPLTDGKVVSGPSDSKRPRVPDSEPIQRKPNDQRRDRLRSPEAREHYRRDYDGKPRHEFRRPISPHSPTYHRGCRSKSPRNIRRYRSPLNRRLSRSPGENKQFKPGVRKRSSSPISPRKTDGNTIGRDSHTSELRRPISRNGHPRSQTGSDSEKNAPLSQKMISSDRRLSNRRRSPGRRRSHSPRNKLAFGDHRLRAHLREYKKYSSRNSSRQASRSPTGNKPRDKSKSPLREAQPIKSRTPSPAIDVSNLTDEERRRIEKRRLKFKSEANPSGKVILNAKENTVQQRAKAPKVPITFEFSPVKDVDSIDQKPSSRSNAKPISSRLGLTTKKSGRGSDRDEKGQRRRHLNDQVAKYKSKSDNVAESNHNVEDFSNNNSPKGSVDSRSPTKSMGDDDLRTKLQQKRAANVGRIFSVALKDTLHKDSSTSPRS